MALASNQVPLAITAKTTQELSSAVARLQAQAGGKVSIITIYWDGKNHVLWYYPLKGYGMAISGG